jgi:hypothetical protein
MFDATMQAAQLGTVCLEFRDRVRHRLACHIIETNEKGLGANGHDRHIYIPVRSDTRTGSWRTPYREFFEPSSSNVIREAWPIHVPITRPLVGFSALASLERPQSRLVGFRGGWVAQRDLEFEMWSSGLPRDRWIYLPKR